MKNLLFVFIALFVIGCGGGSISSVSTPGTGSLEGFNMNEYPKGGLQKASKSNANGELLEEGDIVGGQRQGAWVTYHDGRNAGVVKTITSYVDNNLQGPYFEFDNIGRLELKSFHNQGILQGPYVKYKFGKAVEEAFYNDGKLDGIYKTYYQNGKKQQETAYKKGEKDGRSLFYNEEEKVIMDYEYKNGKKVSGGAVTPE